MLITFICILDAKTIFFYIGDDDTDFLKSIFKSKTNKDEL